MIVAVDIGASATKVGIWRSGRGDPAAIGIEGEFQWSTTLFLDRDRTLLTGVAPENLSRAPRYRGRYVVGVKQQVNKPDPATEPLHRELHFPVGDTQPLVRGIGAILRHALTALPGGSGPPEHLVLTHPVVWTGIEKAVLVEAAASVAGGVPVTLVSEAEAVGLHAASRLPAEGIRAVLDFGASTFDFAVLRTRPDASPQVRYEGGRLVGGDDFDARVLHLVRDAADDDERRVLADLAATEPALLRAEAEQVKKALSDADEAVFAIRTVEVPVYREDFEEAIAPLVLECRALVHEALRALGEHRPDAFVLSGGAARIPCVREQMAGLATELGAEIVDISREAQGSPVALGAVRAPLGTGRPRASALRPFTLTADVLQPPSARTPLVAVAGGLATLGTDARLRIWRDDGAGRLSPLAQRWTYPQTVAMTADPAGHRLLLASESPAFTEVRLNARGEDSHSSVYGHLAATPSRPEGRVTALAYQGPFLAWCVDGGPTGTLLDTSRGRWRPLTFGEPVAELFFLDPGLLLARTATGLELMDAAGRETLATLALPGPEPVALAVEPASGTVVVSGPRSLSTYTVNARHRFEPRWRRALKAGGPVTCVVTGGEPTIVVVYDAHDQVYRALTGDTGSQVALRDAAARPAPVQLYASPDPGVVYARTPQSIDRLRLGRRRSPDRLSLDQLRRDPPRRERPVR
ncbi:Hsp70 family protein [Streptomyces sp. NPDC004610]|uniref:Hsp70 family protein n=1 Tax=unclassified Streptomyces TaxID=2593676 RepID=UPI0033BB8C0F